LGLIYLLLRPSRSVDGDIDGSWLLLVFLLLLLPIWGGGIWLTPIGPAVFGVQIWNFLFIGTVVALIIAALMATQSALPPSDDGQRLPREQVLARQEMHAWNQFVWILLILMAVSIVFGYWWL
jgi:hypothetical protein